MRRIVIVVAALALLAPTGMASFHASARREPFPPSCGGEEEAVPLSNHTISGTVSGALNLSGGTWTIVDAQVSGAVNVLADTNIAIFNSTIGGSVVTATGDNVFVCQSTIDGALTANSHPASVTSCQSTYGGAITVAGSKGFVLIGDTFDDFNCGTNDLTSGGSNNFVNNTGDIEVGGNQIDGSLVLIGNSGKAHFGDDDGPEIEGNVIKGSLTCVANNPAPIDDGQANSVAGTRTGQCSASGSGISS